jgi:hypothetical protein
VKAQYIGTFFKGFTEFRLACSWWSRVNPYGPFRIDLKALLFNLLSDVTGGVRYSVVREPLSTGTGSTTGRGQR